MRSSSQLRENARKHLKNNYLVAFLTCVIASLLTSFGITLSGSSLASNVAKQFTDSLGMFNLSVSFGTYSFLLTIASFIIGGTVTVGLAQYFLNLADEKPAAFEDLFSHFKNFANTFVMYLLTTLFVSLWTLLFIIPGIVAALSYALTPYILAEHPEMKAMDALKLSKTMMAGNKGRLFRLYLSFFGWYILCLLSAGIGFYFLMPYIYAAKAEFFNEVSGKNYQREHAPQMHPQPEIVYPDNSYNNNF